MRIKIKIFIVCMHLRLFIMFYKQFLTINSPQLFIVSPIYYFPSDYSCHSDFPYDWLLNLIDYPVI